MSRISVVFSTIFLMSLFACSSDVAQPESQAQATSTALSTEKPLTSPQPTTAVLPAGTALNRNFQFGFRFHYRTSRPFLKTSKFLL